MKKLILITLSLLNLNALANNEVLESQSLTGYIGCSKYNHKSEDIFGRYRMSVIYKVQVIDFNERAIKERVKTSEMVFSNEKDGKTGEELCKEREADIKGYLFP